MEANKNLPKIEPQMNNIGVSYLLWLGCTFGLAGLHRFYNKKFVSGFLWLFTMGFFGIGQFIDLFLIPNMVDEHNWKMQRKFGVFNGDIPSGYQLPNTTLSEPNLTNPESVSNEKLMIILAKIAQQKGGKISLTQAVIETEVSFEKVEATLAEMVKRGYIAVENHPSTGIVIYDFVDLA